MCVRFTHPPIEGEVHSLDLINELCKNGDGTDIKDSEYRRGSIVAGPAIGVAQVIPGDEVHVSEMNEGAR